MLDVLQQHLILVDRSSLQAPTEVLQAGFLFIGSFSVFIRSSLTTCRFTSRLANPLLCLVDRDDETIAAAMKTTKKKWQLLQARLYHKFQQTPLTPPPGHFVFENVSNAIICYALGTGKLKERLWRTATVVWQLVRKVTADSLQTLTLTAFLQEESRWPGFVCPVITSPRPK